MLSSKRKEAVRPELYHGLWHHLLVQERKCELQCLICTRFQCLIAKFKDPPCSTVVFKWPFIGYEIICTISLPMGENFVRKVTDGQKYRKSETS